MFVLTEKEEKKLCIQRFKLIFKKKNNMNIKNMFYNFH